MSEHALTAVVTGVAGVAAVLVIRWLLHRAFRGYLRAVEARRGAEDAASLRTRLAVLERLIVGFLFVIVAWQVLTVFPSTEKLGTALLASSAVLAAIVGLALSAPLANIGAGIMLAFTQPVRIGDRVTVDEATGTVDQITLVHTVMVDDQDRRVHVPNGRMVNSIVVNRSIRDPRRPIAAALPVSIEAPIDRAREALLRATGGSAALAGIDLDVRVTEVGERVVWLELAGLAPPDADVAGMTGELRERGLAALAGEGLLPAG